MRIDKLEIRNFRNFDEYDIEFGKKATVLIGKNGSGKTNLIKALVNSVSFPFARGLNKEQSIAVSAPDLRVASIDTQASPDARFDDELNDYVYPLSIKGEACFDEQRVTWEMRKDASGGGLKTTLYKKAFEEFHKQYYKGDKTLPVLAFFADSYPHLKTDIRAYSKSMLRKDGKLPNNFGYYMWDREGNCINLWKERYINCFSIVNNINSAEINLLSQLHLVRSKIDALKPGDSQLEDLKKRLFDLNSEMDALSGANLNQGELSELEFINQRILKFTEPLKKDQSFINKEFAIRSILVAGTKKLGQSIQFVFDSGKKMYFEHLPQGYRRLISITFDIAYRSYILNENKEPEGIVFIDELELHLHPSLQQEVLERFRKTYPKIQFIISTHSPLIISNFKSGNEDERLIKLINEGGKFTHIEVPNIYGVDYNVSLEKVMESNQRSSSIDNLIDSYIILKVKKKEEAAQAVYEELFNLVGTDNLELKKTVEAKLKANL